MIWGSCYMLYCMHMVNIMLDLTFDETLSDVVQIQEKPGAVNKTVATFLTTYCVAFVTVYLMVPNPLIFQVNELNGNIYGVLTVDTVVLDPVRAGGGGDGGPGGGAGAAAVLRPGPLPLHRQRPLLPRRLHPLEPRSVSSIPYPSVNTCTFPVNHYHEFLMSDQIFSNLSTIFEAFRLKLNIKFLLNFLLNLLYHYVIADNHQCPTLVSMRSHLPPLLQPLLQFHAWWHILAG